MAFKHKPHSDDTGGDLRASAPEVASQVKMGAKTSTLAAPACDLRLPESYATPIAPTWESNGVTIYCGDCRKVLAKLPSESVHCIVTSPPYWGLRDYGHCEQIGLEQTPESYVAEMVGVFREARRVLRDDGTMWLNLGDSYARMQEKNVHQSKNQECVPSVATGRIKNAGLKPKDLVGIPWRVAFALQADGWYLRSEIIWHKPNVMPESVTDRPTKSHEHIFLLSKSERYFYDYEAIMEPMAECSESRYRYELMSGPKEQDSSIRPDGAVNTAGMKGFTGKRNKRDVWSIPGGSFGGAHFATFPPALIKPCILAGVPHDGICLDPFFGAGTVGLVCQQQGVKCIGIELNPAYVEISAKRLSQGVLFDAPK